MFCTNFYTEKVIISNIRNCKQKDKLYVTQAIRNKNIYSFVREIISMKQNKY